MLYTVYVQLSLHKYLIINIYYRETDLMKTSDYSNIKALSTLT